MFFRAQLIFAIFLGQQINACYVKVYDIYHKNPKIMLKTIDIHTKNLFFAPLWIFFTKRSLGFKKF